MSGSISAQAQVSTNAGGGKAATTGGMETLSPADKKFLEDSAMVNLTEIKLGELAQQKGESNEVKSFGQRMVTDHTTAQGTLTPIAEKYGVKLPTDLDADGKQKYDKLSKLSGHKFDVAYMDAMVAGHTKVANNMKHEESALKESDLKTWDTNTLKTVEEHKKLATDTDKTVERMTAETGKPKSGGASTHY
jgi:putative membrane protein